ncbi:MAG: dTDP-4-dehydrorhamnose reductase [Victivallaceae bacterium]|nr:dTDP-4-dehydrorhamnose reductase [Victivallaceae bacterium]
MKILITGGKGMLGRTLQKEFRDQELLIADLPECDITDAEKTKAFFAGFMPDVVIHCAAMTAVDRCETEEKLAALLNVEGTRNVAVAAHACNAKLIAISTDYVFRGDAERPYTEEDAPDPQTVYGKTKFGGEEMVRKYCPNHLICRISWLYGPGGPSFVHAMMKLADGTHPQLKVVADQVGNPTSTFAVARKLRELIRHPEYRGTWHLTCEGEASWCDFAREIFRLAGIRQEVVPCTTAEFPRPAPRPANSRLVKGMLKKAGLPPMPDWHDALREFMQAEF